MTCSITSAKAWCCCKTIIWSKPPTSSIRPKRLPWTSPIAPGCHGSFITRAACTWPRATWPRPRHAWMKPGAWPASSSCSPCTARAAPGACAWRCTNMTRHSSSIGWTSGTGVVAITVPRCCPRSGWPMPGCSDTWANAAQPNTLCKRCRCKRCPKTTDACNWT
ncbi:hypothetical protein D3C81_1508300 [compost metagenome]